MSQTAPEPDDYEEQTALFNPPARSEDQPGQVIATGMPDRPTWRVSADKLAREAQQRTRALAKLSQQRGGKLAELSQKITVKWIYSQGTWIFGGLIIASLIFLQDLLQISHQDRAFVIASLSIAIALPLNVTGLWIVRYSRTPERTFDAEKVASAPANKVENEPGTKLISSKDAAILAKRQRLDLAITTILVLSTFFTIIGLAAALWHIAWIVTIFFLLAIAGGLLLILRLLKIE